MAKRDLNYVETHKNRYLALNPDSTVPEMLKRGITLMLFSYDPEIRNFNGSSVVNAFATIPQTGFEGINFYLTIAAKRIQTILADMYGNVNQVYFDCTESGSTLSVRLNIQTTDGNILTATVYE